MKPIRSTAFAAVICFAALVQSPALAQGTGSKLLGAWSDVTVREGEDPHASGIEVEIWSQNGQVSGFMSEYVGPVADPPVGKLDAIRYDEKTGSIAFNAKLSVGVVPAAGGNAWLPSKNLYEFRGTVGKSGMTGTLRRKFVDEEGKETAYEENLTLKSKGAAEAGSYAEWNNRWNEAVKKRGPKW